MQNYEQFWLENNKPKKKAVIKIKRQKPVETTLVSPRKKIVVKRRGLIAVQKTTKRWPPFGVVIFFLIILIIQVMAVLRYKL